MFKMLLIFANSVYDQDFLWQPNRRNPGRPIPTPQRSPHDVRGDTHKICLFLVVEQKAHFSAKEKKWTKKISTNMVYRWGHTCERNRSKYNRWSRVQNLSVDTHLFYCYNHFKQKTKAQNRFVWAGVGGGVEGTNIYL